MGGAISVAAGREEGCADFAAAAFAVVFAFACAGCAAACSISAFAWVRLWSDFETRAGASLRACGVVTAGAGDNGCAAIAGIGDDEISELIGAAAGAAWAP